MKLFRNGDLGRLIMGAFRKAKNQPLNSYEIAGVIEAQQEYERGSLQKRVRTNLTYLVITGRVVKIGRGRLAKWVPVRK
jgi:hypothetical protein